ncbi:MAG: DUF5131 family protein [Blastocatellia bacterium]
MADKTPIQWTATINKDGSITPGATWNPIRARNLETEKLGWHCEVVSAGCCKPGDITCYANQINKGFFNLGTGLPYTRESREKVDIFLDEETLLQPLRWRKPRKIFVCSMTDWMGEWVPDEWIDRILTVAALCPQHTFQFLTKRAERLPRYFGSKRDYLTLLVDNGPNWGVDDVDFDNAVIRLKRPLPNLWLGVSCEDQKTADERIPHLLQAPAAVRFVSAEPLLARVNLRGLLLSDERTAECACGHGHGFSRCPNTGSVAQTCHRCDCKRFRRINGIHQVIIGGESGPGARPLDLAWVRAIIRQCEAAGVATFVKQLGKTSITQNGEPYQWTDHKGGDMKEWPADLRVREFPINLKSEEAVH